MEIEPLPCHSILDAESRREMGIGAINQMLMEPKESLLTETKGLLRKFDLRAKKGLGQHFLVNGAFLKEIVSAAELTPTDVVIEVGPGLGVLTRELASRVCRVIAIELDEKLATILKTNLASFNNLTIVNKDVLKIDPESLLREQKVASECLSYKVVANLPYYIASPVMRHFLEASVKPQIMVVMVQKEVAQEITAKPGQLGLLGISVQVYGEPKIVKYVPARNFYPAPEVDSAILRVAIYPKPLVPPAESEGFFRLARAGFSAARKQIVNSLGHGLNLPKTDVLSLLQEAGILPQRRAETLAIGEWIRLWRIYADSFGTG